MKTATELQFGFWDVTARADASLLASENQAFSDLNGVNVDDAPVLPNVATLEPGVGWPLNGTRGVVPDAGGPFGWWSVRQSGLGGVFASPPTLTVTFTQPHSSIGITLNFVNTLPETVNLKWYNLSGVLMEDVNFHPNRFNYFCDRQVENYGKLIVTVPKMKAAGRFLRVSHIIFGTLEVLSGPKLEKALLCEEIDHTALTLPVSTLDVIFCTPDGRFSLTDLTGAYRLFQRRQPIEIFEYLDAERRYMGVQYLNELSATEDGVTGLGCTDILGVLENIEHKGGVYARYPVRTLLGDLLTADGVSFSLDPVFEGTVLSGHLPIGSKRAALRQLAFAIGAIVDTSRREVVALYPIPGLATGCIQPGRKEKGHMMRLEPLVTQVNITAHTYRLDAEVKQISSTRYEPGNHTIRFSAPVEVSAVTGGDLLEKGQNYAVVSVTKAGDVAVTGRAYADDQTVFTAQSPQLWAGERESVKSVEDATLVDREKGQAVADRLFGLYQDRYTDEGTILPGADRVGEKTELMSLGGRTVTGIVDRMSIDLTGGYLAKIAFRGR